MIGKQEAAAEKRHLSQAAACTCRQIQDEAHRHAATAHSALATLARPECEDGTPGEYRAQCGDESAAAREVLDEVEAHASELSQRLNKISRFLPVDDESLLAAQAAIQSFRSLQRDTPTAGLTPAEKRKP